ncbi:MAG: mechanosensitive ion channel [bacterium]|nr:mechanosensitive ion channel [bacterium]
MNADYYAQLMQLAQDYGPKLAFAVGILAGGWLVAKFAAYAIKKLLDKTDVDNKLAEMITGGRSKDLPIEKGLAKLVYWLIMLFVIVAVLQVLGLTVVTGPLNALLTKITGFLPNVLGAAALGAVAWALATVLRLIVKNLLSAFNLDEKIGESAGEETKSMSLAATLADGVYYLIFLLFLPQILDALEMEGLSPVKDMVGEILGFLPNLLGAVVVFFIFYLVARIVQRLVANLLATIGFNKVPEWLGLGDTKEGALSASSIAGWVVMIVILFMGAIQAFNTLGLAVVSNLANELMQGLFSILVAVVIFAAGLFFSRLAHKAITASGHRQSGTLANVARLAILVVVGAMALHKTGLAPDIVNLAFGALIAGLALACGLAFGLGGRESAARTIESWRGSED